jgi:hypothetical protein
LGGPAQPEAKTSFVLGKLMSKLTGKGVNAADEYFTGRTWSPSEWRRRHNYFLDRGMKFMVSYKSPMIGGTDLFDLEKFACYEKRGSAGLKVLRHDQDFGKEWWIHPSFWFNGKFQRIGVRLQDLTSGELRWDAVYDVGPAPHKSQPGPYPGSHTTPAYSDGCHGDTGTGLCAEERPIGGSKPYFQPDWCPAPADFVAHKYRLTITNLSQHDHPEDPLVGEILFTQYGPSQLANTYAYENSAPKEASTLLGGLGLD